MIVNVLEAGEDLEQDALDTGAIERLMVASFHQLVQVAVHVLHDDVQLLAKRVEEDVVRRYQMWVVRQRLQEDDFSELRALVEAVERLLHGLDGNLRTVRSRHTMKRAP